MREKGLWNKSLGEGRQFVKALSLRYPRLAITGIPGVGKSSLCKDVSSVWCSDVLQKRWRTTWEDQTEAVLQRGRERPLWIFEGVTIARALREGLVADGIVYVTSAYQARTTPKRDALAKSVSRWMHEALEDNDHGDMYELHLLHPDGKKPYE